jgi:hypothetical protein
VRTGKGKKSPSAEAGLASADVRVSPCRLPAVALGKAGPPRPPGQSAKANPFLTLKEPVGQTRSNHFFNLDHPHYSITPSLRYHPNSLYFMIPCAFPVLRHFQRRRMSLFAKNQLKCLPMKSLRLRPSFSNQGQSRLIKVISIPPRCPLSCLSAAGEMDMVRRVQLNLFRPDAQAAARLSPRRQTQKHAKSL